MNTPRTLDSIYNPKQNNLNALRILAAAGVLFSHSYPLSGYAKSEPLAALGTSIGSVCVGVFFVISGFLIARSVQHHELKSYIIARCLRIVPGLAVVVALTTLILGPIVSTLQAGEYFANRETWSYLWTISVFDVQYRLPGVFMENPLARNVNGSLWTIPLESAWYLVLPILLSLSLLSPRRFYVFFILFFMAYFYAVHSGMTLQNAGPRVLRTITLYRFIFYGLFFSAGVFLYVYRAKVPISGSLALILAVLIYATAGTVSFRVVIVPAIAYLVIFVAVSGRWGEVWPRKLDLSYGTYLYAFPIQQTLAHYNPSILPWQMTAMALPTVLACAWLSWRYVEEPSLALKARLIAPRNSTAARARHAEIALAPSRE